MSSKILAALVRALDNDKDSPTADTGLEVTSVGPSRMSGHHTRIRQGGQSPYSFPLFCFLSQTITQLF